MIRNVCVGLTASTGVACAAVGRLAHRHHKRGKVPTSIKYHYTTPPCREEMLTRMKNGEVFDVLVVGGGATGSGVALDAATRGLKCALVEGNDFASGTSSKSTKLLHGGIRYLEAAIWGLDVGMFKLVCEALDERSHMMRIAPYMNKPLPILMPVYKLWEVPMLWFGVKMYDWIGKVVCEFQPGLPNCFWISRSNASFFFPLLKRNKLKGSIVYYDGQMNDARLNLQLALTSTVDGYIDGMTGAAVANHCKVLRVLPPQQGGVFKVEVEDTLTGNKFTVPAKTVVNCTGPLSDVLRCETDPSSKKLIATSAGTHVTLPDYYSSAPFGMIIPETSDGRVLYYLPWEGSTIAGTTDRPAAAVHDPAATKEDVDFVVKESCRYLDVTEEDCRADIVASWSGLRPLVKDPNAADGETAQLSRSHEIVVDSSGLISVLGGKWTTYRKMAEDAVNKTISLYGPKFAASKLLPPRTKFLLLANAIDPTEHFATSAVVEGSGTLPIHLHHKYDIPMETSRYLVRNYGFRALDVCRLGSEDNSLQPLSAGYPFLRAEVVYAIRHEMARTPSDIVGRRLRVAFKDINLAKKVLEDVTSMMAKELKWNPLVWSKMHAEGVDYLRSMEGGI